MSNGSQPIIVKKVKKGGHGHHGGAWKVAYADFVTAMMAFFLLLWLLNSVTQEQLEGIANYFTPTVSSTSTSGAGGVLGGQSIAEPGAVGEPVSPPPIPLDLPQPMAGGGPAQLQDQEETAETTEPPDDAEISEEEIQEMMRAREEQQFDEARDALRQAIESVPSLKPLAESLLVDETSEGMRIQIVDQEGLAMFPRGGADMYDHTQRVLALVAEVVKSLPQEIAIAGHTDATPFASGRGYTNWELSADRANASRRVLMDLGVPENRIARVVGKAAEEPLFPDDPENPRNRRISIVLLRGTGEEPVVVPTPPAESP